VGRRVPEISQHDTQTSFNISQLYPLPSLPLNLLSEGSFRFLKRCHAHAGIASSQQQPPRSINGRPQVSANVGYYYCSLFHRHRKDYFFFFILIRMNDRYMLWKKLHYPPPGHPRQAFQAMPLLHEAMVSEPESANLRWGLSG
jgi:hypothetical protein